CRAKCGDMWVVSHRLPAQSRQEQGQRRRAGNAKATSDNKYYVKFAKWLDRCGDRIATLAGQECPTHTVRLKTKSQRLILISFAAALRSKTRVQNGWSHRKGVAPRSHSSANIWYRRIACQGT